MLVKGFIGEAHLHEIFSLLVNEHFPLGNMDAEKGDAVIELHEFTGNSYKHIAQKELSLRYQTVKNWISKSNRISPRLKQGTFSSTLSDTHINFLLKYSHVVQDLLATFIVGWNEKNPERAR